MASYRLLINWKDSQSALKKTHLSLTSTCSVLKPVEWEQTESSRC